MSTVGGAAQMTDVQDVQQLGKAALKVFSHAKFTALSPAAGWLWLRGLTYLTAGNGSTGGLITPAAFKQIGGTDLRALELVKAGLWRRTETGWRMLRLNAIVAATTDAQPVTAQPTGTEVLKFPAIGEPGYWVLTKEQVDTWQQTYTGVDVMSECRRAKSWVEADTKARRKTMRGMPKFLVRWLSSASDRGGSARGFQKQKPGLTGPAPAGKYDHLSQTDDEHSNER